MDADGKKILIASSNEAFAKKLIGILSPHSFTLSLSKDIKSTFLSLSSNKFDLVIIDLLLPEFGAYAFARTLRNSELALPLLLVVPSDYARELYPIEKQDFAGCISRDDSEEAILSAVRAAVFGSMSFNLLDLVPILEASKESMLLADAHGKIYYANSAFSKITGFSLDDVLGQNPRIWKSGKQDRNYYEEMWTVIQSGKPWLGRVVNRTKDGALYSANLQITPLRNRPEKKPSGFLAIHSHVKRVRT